MSPTALRIVKWAGGIVAALVLLVVLLVVGLNTGPGRGFVAGQLAAFETESGINVRVQRIDGSLYGRMTLVGLEVRDPRGVFLSSPAVTVDWRPFAYVRSKIDVRELSAATITLARLPEFKPTPTDRNAPLLPDIDLAVGKLAIQRFVVEPPVTGKRHIIALNGSADIADGRARINADAAAQVAAGVAGGDRLVLKLDAVPDENRLIVDAKLTAPAGGLVDSYAALGKPITLAVDGRGAWSDWQGRASGTVGGQQMADLAITGRSGDFRIKGRTRPGLILPDGPAARLVEPGVDLDIIAKLAERRIQTRARAKSGALDVNAEGLIDLAQSRFGNFRVDVDLLRAGAIADNVVARDARAQLLLDGAFATPLVNYRVTASAIGFDATLVEGLAASGAARIDADRILVPIHATARRVTGLNAAAGGLLTNLRIDGDLAYSNGRVLSDNLKLRSDRIDATAIVVADIAKGTYTGALKGRVNDYQVDGLGRVNVVTDAELVTGPNGGFGIKGRVRVETRRLDNASVRDFLGGNAVITADVGFTPEGVATVANLRMNAPQFRITSGSGSYRPDGRIDFRAAGNSSRYGPVTVAATGTVARPVVRLRAARPNVGIQLTDVEAELIGTAAGYRVRAKGGSPYGPFSADLLVRAGAGPLAVDIRAARFAGIDFSGSVAQTRAGPFAGTLRANGSGFDGTITLAAQGDVQRADVLARASNARVPADPPITIQSGIIRATALLLPAGPSITGDARLVGVRRDTLVIANTQARIRYQNGRGTVALTADGRSGVPFNVALQAAIAPNRIRANATGAANSIAFRLAAPADIVSTPAGWRLAPATIVLPQGQVRVAGLFGAAMEVQSRIDNLDLSILRAFAPGLGIGGKATGTIDFAMPAGGAFPTGRARIDINRFTRTGVATVSNPVDIAVLGTLSSNGGDLRALVRRGGGVIGRMQARLAPVPGGAEGWSTRLLAAPLAGGIRYNGPAEVLWGLTGITGQELRGPIAIAADFGGRLTQPSLTGVIRANALAYENEIYGTRITNIALDGRFTQSRLELTSLTGRAGSGTISARGNVGLDAASGFPIDIAATLDRAQLARSDALGATVSGTVNVTNSRAAGALIKADLRIPEARYEIIRQGAAEVAELEGVRRKGAPPPSGVEEGAAVPSLWKLDMRIRADNQLFVSGMGLESEWRADLRVGGTSATPTVVGDLEIVRGTYSFAGRRFDVTSGKVTFQGGQLTDPLLDIVATTTVEDVTATITISGRAQRPQIAFTSTPALAQDEVLSRLLFGESVTSLSPTQAIQLAAALNSLRGSGGGGLNPLGKLRSATGIDRLRVLGADKTAGRGTALAAGQYISNDIYVEVITDARGFTATQLEIALSKTLSVLSQTSSFGGSNVTVRYSKDY
jgi:translocation and assembly module TamB